MIHSHSLSPPLPPPPVLVLLRLLSHVFDPDLDKPTPREYIVYACPTGPLGEAIEEYMEATLSQMGRNGAHKSFPHVTLCQFFKVSAIVYKNRSAFDNELCTKHACTASVRTCPWENITDE